jgi:hypothetical protein
VKLDVGIAFGESNRLHVIHATHAQPALHHIGRQTELLLPIGDEGHTAEMATGREPANVKPIGITAECARVFVNPCNATSHLLGNHGEIDVRHFDIRKVQGDIVNAG